MTGLLVLFIRLLDPPFHLLNLYILLIVVFISLLVLFTRLLDPSFHFLILFILLLIVFTGHLVLFIRPLVLFTGLFILGILFRLFATQRSGQLIIARDKARLLCHD